MAQLTRAERRRRAREAGSRPAGGSPPPQAGPPSDSLAGKLRARPRLALLWILGLWVLGAAIGAAWWVLSPHPSAPAQQDPALGEKVPDEGFTHVPFGTPIEYRAHPPSSGTHYPSPAPSGVYPQGLAPGYWVHSLEHGYIVLAYKPPVSDEMLRQFDQMVRDFPKSKYENVKLLFVPYTDMPHPFAALAWDWRLWMDEFDRAKLLAFYKAHVDHGREDLP